MEWVVDQLEAGTAALETEDGRMIEVPSRLLPSGVRPGDVLRVSVVGGDARSLVRFQVDPEAKKRRKNKAGEILKRLKQRDPGGDIEL